MINIIISDEKTILKINEMKDYIGIKKINKFIDYLIDDKYYKLINDKLINDEKISNSVFGIFKGFGNDFFKWFEEKFPDIIYISNNDRDHYLEIYKKETGLIIPSIIYFNKSLSNKYQIINKLINGKQKRGYKIIK